MQVAKWKMDRNCINLDTCFPLPGYQQCSHSAKELELEQQLLLLHLILALLRVRQPHRPFLELVIFLFN